MFCATLSRETIRPDRVHGDLPGTGACAAGADRRRTDKAGGRFLGSVPVFKSLEQGERGAANNFLSVEQVRQNDGPALRAGRSVVLNLGNRPDAVLLALRAAGGTSVAPVKRVRKVSGAAVAEGHGHRHPACIGPTGPSVRLLCRSSSAFEFCREQPTTRLFRTRSKPAAIP